MASPQGLRLGACAHCGALAHISPHTGLCHECIVLFKHLRRRQRDQERLLAFGLENGLEGADETTPRLSTTPVVRKTAAPLFVLCVAYLSNNVDLIEQEAIHYLPSEVRYFLFLLELSHKRLVPPSSKSSSVASSSPTSAAPRLRLAKRFLSSTNAASPFHSSSFEAFDFSALKSLTCLNPIQVENVFDYLTSFGRSSIEGLRVLSLKGLPFINDAALKTVAAQMRLLRVLDISFCDNITDEGIAALLPRFKPAQTRDSWEELEDGDSSGSSEDSSDESSLLCGLLHLRRLGIYGCGQLTRANLKALRIAFTGRPALTVYTSMLLVRGVDDDDGHAYAYDDRAAVLLAAAAAHKPDPALWEVTAAAANSSSADREWSAEEEVELSREEKPKSRPEADEELDVDRRHLVEGSLKVVTFVNDTLQWNVAEEEAVYALHGYQIEEIEELRGRYYAPHQEGDGGGGGSGSRYIGIGRGGRQPAQPAMKKKVRPSLYVPYAEQLQDLDEIRSARRAEHSRSLRRGFF